MNCLKIILASQSPRRKELLKNAGFDFEVVASDIEEMTKEIKPDKVVEELSYIKTKDVFDKIKDRCQEDFIVIGADTIVSVDEQILGKPETALDAYQMIQKIQGRTHQVYTGVTILRYCMQTKKEEVVRFTECTDVTVYPMTDDEINEYISTGDCMDKAGAYGIQSDFGVFVEKIHGDYNNVVGLPVARLYHVLKEMMG